MREWCGHGCLTDAMLLGWLQKKGTRACDHAAVLAITAEIAGALACLHSQGIVHGNLSGEWCVPGWKEACMVRQCAWALIPDMILSHLRNAAYGLKGLH